VTQLDYIPFNRPYATGEEFAAIREAIANGHLSGNGPFTRRCCAWLERQTGCAKALLTHSGTGALELAALLADVGPGDEVIVPSFTFVSTANAFVLRGAVPVFVDIRADTLNLDETLIEDAITPRTKAIVPVHYSGVGCEMDAVMEVAARHGALVIEDASHSLTATYKGQPLGTIGELGILSFHETKNVHCGEGGALLIRDPAWAARAEIVHEKGTDRSRFIRGEVDKYTWVDVGSSYPPSEVNAAYLWVQLEASEWISRARMEIWERYHEALGPLEARGVLRRPAVPAERRHAGHIYYVLVEDLHARNALLQGLERRGVNAVFHYVPLHASPAGSKYGRVHGDMRVTQSASERLVRLPLWVGMTETHVERVVEAVTEVVDEAMAPVAT
jgi:dTDP-4-amino-4,6-dideoxygalactose transaminase